MDQRCRPEKPPRALFSSCTRRKVYCLTLPSCFLAYGYFLRFNVSGLCSACQLEGYNFLASLQRQFSGVLNVQAPLYVISILAQNACAQRTFHYAAKKSWLFSAAGKIWILYVTNEEEQVRLIGHEVFVDLDPVANEVLAARPTIYAIAQDLKVNL